jgi:hypothetical protein
LVRRPRWLSHPNGVSGIKTVQLLADDPAALRPGYARLVGDEQVSEPEPGALKVKLGRHRLAFSTVRRFREAHPSVAVSEDFPLPGIVALELAVRSRKRTATYLTKAEVVFEELPDGRLYVPPGEANGTVILFADA